MDTIIQYLWQPFENVGFTIDDAEAIQFLILVVLTITAIAIFIQIIFIIHQLKTQKKILKAQLLKDRIMLGWETDTPITTEHIDNLAYLPNNFMPKKCIKLYDDMKKTSCKEKREEKKRRIGKYLYLSKVYGYFRWILIMSKEMDIDDQLDDKWTRKWIRDICQDDVFIDIREFNKREYSKFEDYIKKQIKTLEKEDFEEVECDINNLFKKLIAIKIINKNGKIINNNINLGQSFMGFSKEKINLITSILKQQIKLSNNANKV
jgi:hypothetical protein